MNHNFTKTLVVAIGLLITVDIQVQGQIINTIGGNGTAGYSGDGIPATSGEFNGPEGVAVDDSNNVFIGDHLNYRVREISGGIITTVVGTGIAGYSGDGGAATDAQLNTATGVAVDDSGNLYIADYDNERIRKVSAKTGIIITIAGNGTQGYSGDGGQATDAELYWPLNIAIDTAGNIYIADTYNYRIRKIAIGTGIISTFAGTGVYGYSGDGGLATNAEITNPWGLVVDDSENVYITDTYNERIRKINGSTDIITTIAGNGTGGYAGDGGPATSAELYYPTMVALDACDNIYIADWENNAIREITKSSGIITTVAGNGTAGFWGDGGPATNAELDKTWGVALDDSGNIYMTDYTNSRVRKVTGVVVAPTIKVIPNPVSICSGNSVTLTASGANAYTWSPATTLSSSTGDSVAATPTVTTIYSVAGTFGGCLATGTDTVKVTPSAPLTIQPPSPLVCSGQSDTITVSGGGTNYTWTPSSGLNDTTTSVVIANPTATTIYTVTSADSGGCISMGTDTVKIIPAPPLTIEPLDTLFCSGQSATLYISNGGSNFMWNPSAGLSADTGTFVVASPTLTTTYTVTGTNSSGCADTGTDIVINPLS